MKPTVSCKKIAAISIVLLAVALKSFSKMMKRLKRFCNIKSHSSYNCTFFELHKPLMKFSIDKNFGSTGPVGRAVTRSLWSGRSEVQVLGQSNRTQCCKRLAIAATFHQKELCGLGAAKRRWAPPTRYTLRRITASVMKDFIWFEEFSLSGEKMT